MRRRFQLKWAFIQTLLYVFYNMCKAEPDDLVVEALLDGSAKMPCDVLQKSDDTVEFVFWYKNDGVTALYTLDAREGKHLEDAVHMKNETYADRVQFHLEGAEPYLQMDKLREEDTGAYFCRVDYQWSATELKKVELVVVVPPKRVVIHDDSGQEVRDIAGPYKERSDVTLFCEAQRGYPSPNVTWWRDGKLWDNTFKKGSNSVVNEMRLRNLSRSELMATFQCKAQNTKLAPPVVRKIVLDLYIYPVTVQIGGRPSALSAGRPVELTCQTVGSRPPAKISWWLNGTQLTDHQADVRENATFSRLRLQPKVRHNRCSLACRAENPKLHDGIIEDSRILNITCGYTSGVPPSDQGGGGPSAEGGRLCPSGVRRGLEPSPAEGGLAVQRAPPLPQRVGDRRRQWKHARLQETHKAKQGTIQVLRHQRGRKGCQSGTRPEHQSSTGGNNGRHKCYPVNEKGRSVSQELVLNISHAPVCKENQQITYVVGLNESVVVRCEVEAIPTDVTFKWEFSNTIRKHYDLHHTSSGTVSNATYRPVTTADYGTLFCWANNSIGHQQTSCFFTVIAPACKPEKVNSNASSSSKDGNENVWHHSALTAGAGVAVSVIVVTAVCVVYCRRLYLEKKHRPIGQILDEEVSIYSRVQCHNTGQQPSILIAK